MSLKKRRAGALLAGLLLLLLAFALATVANTLDRQTRCQELAEKLAEEVLKNSPVLARAADSHAPHASPILDVRMYREFERLNCDEALVEQEVDELQRF